MKRIIKRGFASDNNAGAHPAVLQAMIDANEGHEIGYGDDYFTAQAIEVIKQHFGEDIAVFPVFNGTGANVLSLKNLTESFNSVICAETSHINVDECGAPEKFTGCKLLPVETENGKLIIEKIKKHMHGFGFEHHSQPGVISITQVSELGTVYTPSEIKILADYAHQNNMYLHMDGARLSNAAASLGLGFKEFTADAGVDVLSFGLTKNGAINAEAVIFFDTDLVKNFKYYRKQAMQLGSKMRFMAVQFEALLYGNIWKENAEHANRMAQLLADKISEISQIKITQKVESNGVFAIVPPEIIPKLQKEFFFYMWDEHDSEVRWMTSFDTTEKDVEQFVELVKKLV
ncbi:MAG: low specificity L-threonine aldolase [Candidatus Cloacimonetes bacterium]|nr:low specificity L-threonine aldolase [Candidatus Cloacimonadota bacterium]MCF7813637.1 low specificity L-threonine aldolase [Candidatus Cloacimonadota bacterium]MCF7868316.1 low specificity L-threonine aldolase [Candidatus Cloacimonadota bacterium]MCF7883790.1 low specificity L-threonine aldolase [Candidatus Cloacimonadota bacterium]